MPPTINAEGGIHTVGGIKPATAACAAPPGAFSAGKAAWQPP